MTDLKQFEILPIFFIFFGFSITNQVVILCLIILLFLVIFFIVSKETTKKLFLIPNRFQFSIEIIFSLLLNMVICNFFFNLLPLTVYAKHAISLLKK